MEMMAKNGDRFILHSENGLDYDIEVVNVNPYRPPDMQYAIDVFLNGESVYEDVMFVSEEFFKPLERR